MREPPIRLQTRTPDATADLAARLGASLRPGDSVLLEGPIGAGKSHFARALIRSLMAVPEDVPSPTFTLVQTYDTRKGEVWHADLYRLSAPEEIEELGLTDAFETAICLVEWPDRLAALVPDNALTVRLAADPGSETARHVTLDWSGGDWSRRMEGVADD